MNIITQGILYNRVIFILSDLPTNKIAIYNNPNDVIAYSQNCHVFNLSAAG